MSTGKLSDHPQYQWAVEKVFKERRQRARTDLLWLCNEILGYKDINRRIHGEMIDALQKFPVGTDRYTPQGWHYTPGCPIYNLTGNRKTLILISRDFMKTSVATVAHSIQWILYDPNVRILISTATAALATAILGQIKEQFTSNPMLRELYPELCPLIRKSGKVEDFGNQEEFTVRKRSNMAIKEPTVKIATVETKIGGMHVDVSKCDDIVDRENSRTPGGLDQVKGFYDFLDPIVDHYQIDRNDISPEVVKLYGNHGWFDVVGTRYDFSDLYGKLEDADNLLIEQGRAPLYTKVKKSALAKGTSAFAKDAVATWPERIPIAELQKKELKDLQMACSQYYMNPIPPSSGLVESEDQIKFIPRKMLNDLLPRLRLHVTIDLHGMEPDAKGKDNDYTAMVLTGFGTDGRPYVIDIFHGRPDPFEVIEQIFSWYHRYPRILDFKIQKDHFMRVLAPFIQREKVRRGVYPIIIPTNISNQISKKQKIRGLRSWFMAGDLRFADDLACKQALVQEILRFPKFHDDILDAVSDQLSNKDGESVSDVIPTSAGSLPVPMASVANPQFRGFDPISGKPMFAEDWEDVATGLKSQMY